MRLEHLGENVYQEAPGLYFDEFTVGMTIKHWPGRTISEVDNTWITLLSMNKHPLHFDSEYASTTEFKKVLVNSAVTFALVNGMTVASLSTKAVANLGWDKVRLVSPVYVGDTLYAQSTVLGTRLSKSRPSQGIVTVETIGVNAQGAVVISFERSFLVPCGPGLRGSQN